MMFDIHSSLFWYKLVFMTELLLSEGLAVYTLEKRARFGIRLSLSIGAVYLLAFLFPIFYNALYTSFMFVALFMFTLVAMRNCFDVPWSHVVFCGIVAYTTQHLSYETYNYICTVFDLGNIISVYDEGGVPTINGFTLITYFTVYAFLYWFVWAFVERRIRIGGDTFLERKRILGIVCVIIFSDVLLNALIVYDAEEKLSKIVSTVIYLYSFLSCVLSIGIQFSLLSEQRAEKESEEVKLLWEHDKRMYELSKQNVELINIKCHDLKRQIRMLRKSGEEVTEKALKEIEGAVNFYDGSVKTGNDVLDLLMAEKSLYCTRHDVRLTCIADGEKLNFLSAVDLYSLLENALRNAIEAVEKNEEPEKRFIRMKIVERESLLSIHIENYFDKSEELNFSEGLPQTNKGNKEYHGYGMKSMRMVTEKYGGGLSVSVEDKLFNLNIVFPVR